MTVVPSTQARPVPADWFRSRVDRELDRVLRSERERVEDLAADAVLLVDELARTVCAGGKRIRPLFCYWGYRAAGGDDDQAIARAGAALELLHTTAVIHDDVIDRSRLRRGEPTTHRRLAEGDPDEGDGERFGRTAAILAGDLAQALADRALAESGFAPPLVLAAFRHFNDMRTQAVTGEFLDVVAARRGRQDEAGASRVAALKSASYTVVGPLLMGAALGGAEPALTEGLARYGWPLGEAFQLRDDVLGTFGDPAVTGKDRDTDIREGKQTALVVKARRLASSLEGRLLDERLRRGGLDRGEVEEVRAIIRRSGALAETIELIDDLAAEATAALALPGLDREVADALRALADLVVLRDT